eukprot:4466480-Pyramimonas_sp.AAC.1
MSEGAQGSALGQEGIPGDGGGQQVLHRRLDEVHCPRPTHKYNTEPEPDQPREIGRAQDVSP